MSKGGSSFVEKISGSDPTDNKAGSSSSLTNIEIRSNLNKQAASSSNSNGNMDNLNAATPLISKQRGDIFIRSGQYGDSNLKKKSNFNQMDNQARLSGLTNIKIRSIGSEALADVNVAVPSIPKQDESILKSILSKGHSAEAVNNDEVHNFGEDKEAILSMMLDDNSDNVNTDNDQIDDVDVTSNDQVVVDEACNIQTTCAKRRKSNEIEINRRYSKNNLKVPTKRDRMEGFGKGLRYFSKRVCEKISQKGTTTYSEVAEELVVEFTNPESLTYVGEQYDSKNIRRRVYDSLNVLMAMNIITKNRKEIKWIGFPANSLQECLNLLQEKNYWMRRVKDKIKRIYNLILHQICYKKMIQHNKKKMETDGPILESSCIKLPFLLTAADNNTSIDCKMSQDKSQCLLTFDDKFDMIDDVELIKKMGLLRGLDKGECTRKDMNDLKALVPKVLHPFVERMATGKLEFSTNELKQFVEICDKTEAESEADATAEADADIDTDAKESA